MNLSAMMRMMADSLDGAESKFRAQMNENVEAGVDTKAAMDAMITLGATGAAMVMSMVDSLPRPGMSCSCRNQCGCTENMTTSHDSADLEEEVEKVASRMGLVQESELAALRKRVVDLENQLNKSSK